MKDVVRKEENTKKIFTKNEDNNIIRKNNNLLDEKYNFYRKEGLYMEAITNIVKNQTMKGLIISKEDFKNYFKERNIIGKEEYRKYLETKNNIGVI